MYSDVGCGALLVHEDDRSVRYHVRREKAALWPERTNRPDLTDETVQNLRVIMRLSETDGGRIALRQRGRDQMCR